MITIYTYACMHADETPLVAQFGAKNGQEFSQSIQFIAPYVDAVDLNCGCPQKWALQEGIGASLVDPENWPRLLEIVQAGLTAAQPYNLPVSVKIRILPCSRVTVELARRLESLGVAWLTVHGRTKGMKPSDDPDFDLIRQVKQSVRIPVIANGNVFSLADAEAIQMATGANGIMAARGLLENPGLFAGLPHATWPMVDGYIRRAVAYGTPTAILHHHVSLMGQALLSKSQHKMFNALANTSIPTLIDYLDSCRP